MPTFVIMYLITQAVFIKCVWVPHPCTSLHFYFAPPSTIKYAKYPPIIFAREQRVHVCVRVQSVWAAGAAQEEKKKTRIWKKGGQIKEK